jgi:hypothetical protein
VSRWTEWRKIAEGKHWFPEAIDYRGPACYELGIREPGSRSGILPIYVGETDNERRRVTYHARLKGLTGQKLSDALRHGFTIYERAQKLPSKSLAKRMQDRLLAGATGDDYPANERGVPK